MNGKFDVIIAANMSSVCYVSRLQLWVLAGMWHTVQCEPCSALFQSWVDHGSHPFQDGHVYSVRVEPEHFLQCKWPLCYTDGCGCFSFDIDVGMIGWISLYLNQRSVFDIDVGTIGWISRYLNQLSVFRNVAEWSRPQPHKRLMLAFTCSWNVLF